MASSFGRHAATQQGKQLGAQAGFAPQIIPPQVGLPVGTFSPGTKIQVGSHRVVIQKYLSEGGFAHVYLVRLPSPVDGTDLAVLKRVAVPDKESLRGMRIEVETMKRLKGHRPIVTYIDSHASEMRGGGYEVFLLMEYCDGGGLIDFMNTRLQHRLTEPEILHILTDVAEGVACMHYLKPPLLHRDLKVENVLIVKRGSSKRFKVCDFGSAAPPRPAPTTVIECRLMDEDVQRHTTLQYRPPEMVDVYRKQPLNEKSDIWALGVFLYKLCYYTTPFEDQSQLAILNASFKYPSYPSFSDRLKRLIASMLQESMLSRPNIYQVLKEACTMQGREIPVHDIYSGQRGTPQTDSKTLPTKPQQNKSAGVVGAVFSPPNEQKQTIPSIVPMRRGRPTVSPGPQKPDMSMGKVTDGDPFTALDSKSKKEVSGADELSSRFPTLDQFSLLHDKGAKFDFDSAATSPPLHAPAGTQHIVERLADEAFASPPGETGKGSPLPSPRSAVSTAKQPQRTPPLPSEKTSPQTPGALAKAEEVQLSRASSIIRSDPDLKAISYAPHSKYVSTGTMTLDLAGPSIPQADVRHDPNRPENGQPRANLDVLSVSSRPAHLRRPSLSSRPSLEDHRRQPQASDPAATRATTSTRPRPASTSFETSTLEFLREKEIAKSQRTVTQRLSRTDEHRLQAKSGNSFHTGMDDSLFIGVDASGAKVGIQTEGIGKSMSVMGVTAPVSKELSKTFGNAINRFENALPPGVVSIARSRSPQRTSIPSQLHVSQNQETTGDHAINTLIDIDEDDMAPEMRREVERQKLENEEKRVAAAQAEHRNRIASLDKPITGPKYIGGAPRTASTIRSRVQSLLGEDHKLANTQRTAQGYGKYTDAPSPSDASSESMPTLPRKPIATKQRSSPIFSNGTGPAIRESNSAKLSSETASASKNTPAGSKPPAPKKKPMHLNSFSTGARPPSSSKYDPTTQPEHLIVVDSSSQPVDEMSPQERQDYMEDFTKRFPSLTSIEMDSRRQRTSELRR